MTQLKKYDAIIIGAGQAGVPLAHALAGADWNIAIVEREHVGGTCVNEGCTPTKTMVASARVAYLARRAGDFGVETGTISVDMSRVRERKRAIVASFRDSNQKRLEEAENIDLIMGTASFEVSSDEHLYRLKVQLNTGDTISISSPKVFINTGARPSIPPIEGLQGVPYLDSTTIMELGEVPEHLLILGGGYVGLEFGQMFRRFGSQVTIIQRGAQVLTHEDHDIADAVTEILQEDGIEILLETSAVRASLDQDGSVLLRVESSEGQITLSGSHLLIAAGRTPNSDNLNLGAIGLKTDQHGYIQVNDRLETDLPGVYALGDIKGGPAFTHISYDDYRIIRDNLLRDKNASIANRWVPYTVFIDPQLGRVGLTEKQAKQQGLDYLIAQIPMSYVARALETDESRGLMKALVDPQNGQILGIAVLGVQGGEIMSLVQTAMLGKLSYKVLKDAVYTHPTLAESMNTLFSSVEG